MRRRARSQRRRLDAKMSNPEGRELLLVVDVASFTRNGFIGSSSFEGRPVDVEFDEADAGVFLSAEICEKLQVRKDSRVSVMVEANERLLVAESVVAGIDARLRISNAKVYYEVGRNGGAIVRMRKA